MPAIQKNKEISNFPLVALTSATLFMSGCEKPASVSASPEMPQTFTAQADFISIGTDMKLKDSSGPFASIEQRTLNWTTTFEYFDRNHSKRATAKQKVFTLGTKIIVKDENDIILGSVEENVWKSLFKVKTSYSIKDSNGKELATSEKLDWAGTTVVLRDSSTNKELIKMKRPWLDMGGATWTVNIYNDLPFDNRLAIFVPAFKTAADKERSSSSSDSDSDIDIDSDSDSSNSRRSTDK